MADWNQMSERERDAWVAENVMGCTNAVVAHYSTSASADYLVLERVRETWGAAQCSVFSDKLNSIWSRRRVETMDRALSYGDALMYREGDYSHAAFLAMQEQPDG